MPPILLKSYQAEYETSNISLKDIINKYGIEEELTREWSKKQEVIITGATIDLPAAPATIDEPDTDKETMLRDIASFKKEIIAYAKEQMADSHLLEIKEAKELMAIVSSVEASLKDIKSTGPTINILVQQLAEKYQDDC